jgi:hypothetical protein
LQRAQDQPDNDQQKNEPDDAPGAVITQRRVLIPVLGSFHGAVHVIRRIIKSNHKYRTTDHQSQITILFLEGATFASDKERRSSRAP